MTEKEIFDEIRSWGIPNRRTQRALLALLEPDKADKGTLELWRKKGVLTDDNRIILYKGESMDNQFQWILFALVWEGLAERVRA